LAEELRTRDVVAPPPQLDQRRPRSLFGYPNAPIEQAKLDVFTLVTSWRLLDEFEMVVSPAQTSCDLVALANRLKPPLTQRLTNLIAPPLMSTRAHSLRPLPSVVV
jgi:hypothetical protein